jgi:hypothetical protein
MGSIILLHFDAVNPEAGADVDIGGGGHTNKYFVDSSPYKHQINRYYSELAPDMNTLGKPTISGGGKFDSCVKAHDGGNFIAWPHHEAFNVDQGNFTIDFWFKATSLFNGFQPDSDPYPAEELMSSFQVWLKYPDDTHPNFLRVLLGKAVRRYDIPLGWGWDRTTPITVSHKDTGGVTHTVESDTIIADSAWYHVAVVKSGNVHRLYINGIMDKEWECVSSFTFAVPAVPVYPPHYHEISIGTPSYFYGIKPLYIDEFHMERGAKWTANFTPPDAPYGG